MQPLGDFEIGVCIEPGRRNTIVPLIRSIFWSLENDWNIKRNLPMKTSITVPCLPCSVMQSYDCGCSRWSVLFVTTICLAAWVLWACCHKAGLCSTWVAVWMAICCLTPVQPLALQMACEPASRLLLPDSHQVLTFHYVKHSMQSAGETIATQP